VSFLATALASGAPARPESKWQMAMATEAATSCEPERRRRSMESQSGEKQELPTVAAKIRSSESFSAARSLSLSPALLSPLSASVNS